MQNKPVPEQEQYVPKSLLGKVMVIIVLTIAYFYAGKLGLSLAFINPSASAVWPPAGMALAAFLLLGDYVWPAILLGAFLVNLTTSGSIPSSLAIALGNTTEGWVGAYLINRYANGSRAFARAQDVLKFAILAGLIGTAISATIGVTSLIWDGLAAQSDFVMVWSTWWLGDATGILIVAPLLILWATSPRLKWTAARTAEAGLLLSSAILLALLVFGSQSPWAHKTTLWSSSLRPGSSGRLSASVNGRPPP